MPVSGKPKTFFTTVVTKSPARLRRNQNPEYLPQRRKGRKEIKLPDLASWREQFPLFGQPRVT